MRPVPALFVLVPAVARAAAPSIVPRWAAETTVLGLAPWQWAGLVLAGTVAWPVARAVAAVASRVALRLARRTDAAWDDALVTLAREPVRLLVSAGVLRAAVVPLELPEGAAGPLSRVLTTLALVALTWLALRLVSFLAQLLEARLTAGVDAEGRVRGIRTQLRLVRQLGTVVVALVGGALVLLQVDEVRSLGASLLASAGIAGIIVGLAAQRSIGTLLAGLQLSVTQPIRLGDTVIVENEWGQIEEITLTYVVVRVWDERRLVVPITRFLEQPFQNWTRSSPQILGTVFLWVDYGVPVAAVRAELQRFVEGHPLWDRRVCGLQVTETTERTVQVRALVSSADASANWDLRCDVREHLVGWLQGLDGGRHLPRVRVAAEGADEPARLGSAA